MRVCQCRRSASRRQPTRGRMRGSSRRSAASAGDPAHASRARRLPRAHGGPSSRVSRCSSARSTASTRSGSPAFARLDRAVGRLADPHIAISHGLARYLAETEGFAEDAFTVVHYGIEPGSEPAPYEGPPDRLLCVGRLIPIKGHDILLRACARARVSVPGLQLELAGSGPLEETLRLPCRGPRPVGRGALSRSCVADRRRDREPLRSSSCPRSGRDSAWSRSRRWSGAGR